MKLSFDLCFIYGLHGKLSDPPNGRNFGQNCFADPEAGSILLQREKNLCFLSLLLKTKYFDSLLLKKWDLDISLRIKPECPERNKLR